MDLLVIHFPPVGLPLVPLEFLHLRYADTGQEGTSSLLSDIRDTLTVDTVLEPSASF